MYLFLDVEQGFLPWLMDQVIEQLERNSYGRLIVDGMLREVVVRRMENYNKLEVTDPFMMSHSTNTIPLEKNKSGQSAPATTTEVYSALYLITCSR